MKHDTGDEMELNELAKAMFAQCCLQFANAFVAASHNPAILPVHCTNAIYGTVGSIIHQIDDEKWSEMMKVKPCGGKGCDCHVHLKLFMTELDKLRTRAIQIVAEKRGEQSHEM